MKTLACLKYFVIGGVVILIITALPSCYNRNRLKADETLLSHTINSEEEKKILILKERMRLLKNNGASAGIKFQGERISDNPHPPVSLDILQSRELVRPVKLSQISQEIQYVHLVHPIDSSFVKDDAQLVFTPNYIYAKTHQGIACFDRIGRYIQQICENKGDIVKHNALNGSFIDIVSSASMQTYYGNVGNINAIGDKLFYQYRDYSKNVSQLIVFQPDQFLPSLQVCASVEANQGKIHLGQPVRSFVMTNKYIDLFPLDEQTYGEISGKLANRSVHNILTIHTLNGDTTCAFTDYDPVINYTNTVGRGVEDGDPYYLNSRFHYRPRFNDTIFRVELPNKLIPEYVIGFGNRGIPSTLEGIDAKYKLTDKFVHSQIIDSDRYIFIEYTQDFTCPNTAAKGTLKYNRCIYFKKSGELIHIMKDAKPVQPEENVWPTSPNMGLLNDLDQGLDFWPDGITEDGIAYMQITDGELKKKIQESVIRSKKLNEIAKLGKANGLIIILVK